MSCEICGRSSCTRSFHSLTEQERFDNPSAPAPASDGLTVDEFDRALAEVAAFGASIAPTPTADEPWPTVDEAEQHAGRGLNGYSLMHLGRVIDVLAAEVRRLRHPAPSAAMTDKKLSERMREAIDGIDLLVKEPLALKYLFEKWATDAAALEQRAESAERRLTEALAEPTKDDMWPHLRGEPDECDLQVDAIRDFISARRARLMGEDK